MVPLAGKAVAFCNKVSLLEPLRVMVSLVGKAITFRYNVSLLAPPRVVVPLAGKAFNFASKSPLTSSSCDRSLSLEGCCLF